MFFTHLRSVEFKEIVWSDGRMTVQDIVDHSESVYRYRYHFVFNSKIVMAMLHLPLIVLGVWGILDKMV